MRSLTTETIRGRKAAFALEKEYIELFESLPNANVFFSPEWVYSWLLSLGRKYEVRFITCRDEGQLVGVWPFFEHRIPLIGTSLLPVGAQAADLFDPVAREDAMQPMVEALRALCQNYAFAWMPLLSLSFADKVLKPVAKSTKALHFLRKRTERFIVELDKFNSFEDFMQMVFGPKTRQNLRRKVRRLEEKGVVRFQSLETPEEVSPWITKAMQLEKVSWKGEEGVGIFMRATHRAFYHLLMENLSARGRLRLSILTIDDQLAAYEIGILGTDNYCMHGTAFDPELASFSPGRLLMLHVLEKCMSEKRRIYDFLQNDQEFKRQMSTQSSSFWDWIVLPQSLRGLILLGIVRTLHVFSDWKRRRLKNLEQAKRKATQNVRSPSNDLDERIV
jgi:CelD/BcsL family acetyltransferase involved in cellulose biosynthesis